MTEPGHHGDGSLDPTGEKPERAPIKVAIVDDHALVREGTLELLEHEPDFQVVGRAGSGEDALALFERFSPDVALADVNLPGGSGLENRPLLPDTGRHRCTRP
jgi:DNA-binding NarL/FixJ family response regulator